jgi:DUF3060 family protein
MKKLLLAAIMLVPALAAADKDFMGGKGTTWDCAKDPTVNINHGNGKYTFKGECKAININGGHNTLTIETITELNINGASNTITAGSVDTININGADNKVTWKRSKAKDGKPAVSTLGTGNSVSQGK